MDTSSWKWFRYDEIFDIKHGFYNKKPEDNPEGDIPFIGATDSNNGVTSHSDLETIAVTTKTGDGSNSPMEEKIFENCIAVTNNGSVGYAYFQAKPFTCTHDVNPLYLKGHEINPYIALFLCTLIEKERFRWAYGRKWRPIRMPSSKIKLPVTPEGTPDWKYMEDFVKDQIIPQLPKKAQKVWLQKYDITPQKEASMKLNIQDWEWFTVEDLFALEVTKGSTTDELTEGNEIPYIAAKHNNNGCEMMCAREDNLQFISRGNCIVFICLGAGSAGYALYQGGDFIGMSGKTMCGYNPNLNQYNGIFLATILSKERPKYSFGRSWTGDRLKKTRIKLPVTPAGDPDWQFMEDYIKSLPFSKNLEPSDPNEKVDELMEVKKELIKLQEAVHAQRAQQVTVHINTYNDNSKTINVEK